MLPTLPLVHTLSSDRITLCATLSLSHKLSRRSTRCHESRVARYFKADRVVAQQVGAPRGGVACMAAPRVVCSRVSLSGSPQLLRMKVQSLAWALRACSSAGLLTPSWSELEPVTA